MKKVVVIDHTQSLPRASEPKNRGTPYRNRMTPGLRRPNVMAAPTTAPPKSSEPRRRNIKDCMRSISTPLPTLSFDESFDEFVEILQARPINEAFEALGDRLFKCDKNILWAIREDGIFSATFRRLIKTDRGLIINAADGGPAILLASQRSDVAFNEESDGSIIPGEWSTITIPINPRWVLQIGRDSEKPFTEKDLMVAEKLISKLHIYGDLLIGPQTLIDEAQNIVTSEPSVENLCGRLRFHLRCETIELWYKKMNGQTWMIDEDSELVSGKRMSDMGAIGKIFDCNRTINEAHVGDCPGYLPSVDGDDKGAILAVPYSDEESRQTWVGVARKPTNGDAFSGMDVSRMSTILPFVCRVLWFAISPPYVGEQIDHYGQGLKAILEVAEILSGVLDMDVLLPTIMDRACTLLNAERCSLFLVDPGRKELVTRFHGGLDNAIRLKIGRGIVGSCAETGETVNIKDAYADHRFDRSVDLATGFTTRSLLCVTIRNSTRGDITGVTEMINKKEGLFDEEDERMLGAFNVFCGISLENARLYKASLDLTRQLRLFIQMSVALNNTTDTLGTVLEEIMNNIRSIVNASRVTIFLNSENENELYQYLSIGEGASYGTIFAVEAVKDRKVAVFDRGAVIGRTQTAQMNKAIERILAAGLDADLMVFGNEMMEEEDFELVYEEEEDFGDQGGVIEGSITQDLEAVHVSGGGVSASSSRKSSSVSGGSRAMSWFNSGQYEEEEEAEKEKDVICCLPMFSSDTAILGVIEISSNWKVVSEDIRLLDCFSVFAGVSIERSQLKDRAKGQADVELKNWISEQERKVPGPVPSKLLISMEKLTDALTENFDAPEWDGIGHFKVIFAIFDMLDLLTQFGITNEKLFRFLSEVRGSYKKVAYHNWRHAVDVTQFMMYELITGSLSLELTKLELIAALTAALFHDADHDGFANLLNAKAETPLGILFKNQSVMETHHCSKAIHAISKDDCNIFASMSATDNRAVWSLIISMILSTDMGKHFDLVKEFKDTVDSGKFSMEQPQHRTLLLQMLLKAADVSSIARPSKIANKWRDVTCEEFFRQGDLSRTRGMEYTSQSNDREHLDKTKSQLAFYRFVCLPMFEVVAKAVPKLDGMLQQVITNVSCWDAEETADK